MSGVVLFIFSLSLDLIQQFLISLISASNPPVCAADSE